MVQNRHFEAMERHNREAGAFLWGKLPFEMDSQEVWSDQEIKGSNFLHECRSRKGRYSLNCAVTRRGADKELHDNKLDTPFMTACDKGKAEYTKHK